MENGIQVFEQSGLGSVRVVMQGGEPWFVAKDVCDCLELGNPRTSIALLDEDEKGVHTMDTLGGAQEMSVISEPGLYSLILRSRKPEAKAFKRWVTHDILPVIRKTGGYSMAVAKAETDYSAIPHEIDALGKILGFAGITGNQLAIAADNYYRKRTGISVIEASGVQLVAPQQEQLLTPTQLGQLMGGLSGKKVNQRLIDEGFQIRLPSGQLEPTAKGSDAGGVLMDTSKRHSDGTPVRQLKWPSSVAGKIASAA